LVIPMRFGAGHFMPVELAQLAGVAVTGLGVALIAWGFISLGDAQTGILYNLDGSCPACQPKFLTKAETTMPFLLNNFYA